MLFYFTSIHGAIFTRSFTEFLQLCMYLPTKAPNQQQSGCDGVPSRSGMAQKVSQIFLWPETCLFFPKIPFTLGKARFHFQMFRFFLYIYNLRVPKPAMSVQLLLSSIAPPSSYSGRPPSQHRPGLQVARLNVRT